METTEWTTSQGEALIDPAEDQALISYMQSFDQVKTFEQVVHRLHIINNRKTIGRRQYYLGRALVIVKAYVDFDPAYVKRKMSRNTGEAKSRAVKLYTELNLPPNASCLHDVQKIQDYFGPQGYQIKVFQACCGALWFHDPKFDTAPNKLWLLKNGDHFRGLRRVPVFCRDGSYCEYISHLVSHLGKVFCCNCKH